ncbi:iron-containing redox enzyme family protein [Jiangella asiatica]|uniref:Iron-containing redox enzyme family protein n=1 Tax=Jiangella asiatica TaxID=2530372 RepID=A0A4R5DC52_9ACTN|nr:iron-containing redox enzyme family protein [Jiangella asiatica]TDE08115.1 iron-containing redox enzyme family protein [Jiangella asiatica]
MELPPPRGELSRWLVRHLIHAAPPTPAPRPSGPLSTAWCDDDLQLALWCCYELHYRGFADVPAEMEWDVDVLRFRADLERHWTACLRQLCAGREVDPALPAPRLLRQIVDADDAPSLSRYLQRHATREQFREFARNRSIYQLKEADPHTFGIPRLDGAAKAAMLEIQADEYGGGRPERMHAELFRRTMRWLGLSDEYGYYVPQVPAVTLAVSNLMSLFGLHRRWLAALLGHLAVFEMTSTEPNRRYAAGVRRLGGDDDAARYFDEHVEADAVHEQIAAHDLCGSYLRAHPDAAIDLAFGATACLVVDGLFAKTLLVSWQESSRRAPIAAAR